MAHFYGENPGFHRKLVLVFGPEGSIIQPVDNIGGRMITC